MLTRILDRLPEGTVAVGGGLVVNGLAAYTFITLASRDLGAEAYTPVGLLWALSFLLGPGFFQPLEQETARAIAGRSANGLRSVVRPAAILGGSLALALSVVAVVAAPWPLPYTHRTLPTRRIGAHLTAVATVIVSLSW